MELKKGQKVKYTKDMPYKMTNGQKLEGECEFLVEEDVKVSSDFFQVLEEPKKEEVKKEDKKVEVKKVQPKKNNKK